MSMNKVDAAIDLSGVNEDGENVGVGIIMDESSAQFNILVDGIYFAHVHVDEKLKLEISFSDLIGKTERGKAIEVDLKGLLNQALSAHEVGEGAFISYVLRVK